jgi:DNA polymerase III psi subunit
MIKVDNPLAFRYLLQEDLFLLPADKVAKPSPVAQNTNAVPNAAIEPDETPLPLQTPEVKFNYLGSNNKRFLILVNYHTEEHIAAHHLTALTNILKRMELAIEDVAILNTHKQASVTMDKLVKELEPQKLLVLGKAALPTELAVLELNKPAAHGSIKTLYSFSFDEMMDSNDMKKAFWDQMKTL